MPCPRSFLFAFAFWGGVMLIPEAGRSADVDVALVLAVDISNSMDTDEQELQREGYVAAFRSPLIHQVIRSGTSVGPRKRNDGAQATSSVVRSSRGNRVNRRTRHSWISIRARAAPAQ